MSNITFVPMPEQYKVKLDGKIVGVIKKSGDAKGYGWRYFPKGDKIGGEPFQYLHQCQKSLLA